MWFGLQSSPIRYAVSDGSGNLMAFSDSEVAGHSYTLQFTDGSRLMVKAATTGPGQRGEFMSYQGYGLQILSWTDDGTPTSVRATGPNGEVVDVALPLPSAALNAQSTRRKALALTSVTDPCPAPKAGDDAWPDNDAQYRDLRQISCRLLVNALLKGHPTLWLTAEMMDYIASKAELKVKGFTKAFRQDLPSAWQRSKGLVSKLSARLNQALERANGSLRVPDVLLNVGIRASQQLLPPEDQTVLLNNLAKDLGSLQPGQAPTGLQTLDLSKMSKPSPSYVPSPAPTMPAALEPSTAPPVVVRETPAPSKPTPLPKLADWAGAYRLQGGGIVLTVHVNDRGVVTRCEALELVTCQGTLTVNADGTLATLQLSGNDGETPVDISGRLSAQITPDGSVTGSFEGNSASEGGFNGTLVGNRHGEIDNPPVRVPVQPNRPVELPLGGTADKDGCFKGDGCLVTSSRWSSSGQSFQVILRNTCARVAYRLVTEFKSGGPKDEMDGIREGRSTVSTSYNATGRYAAKAVGSLAPVNDYVCANKVKGWNDPMTPK